MYVISNWRIALCLIKCKWALVLQHHSDVKFEYSTAAENALNDNEIIGDLNAILDLKYFNLRLLLTSL